MYGACQFCTSWRCLSTHASRPKQWKTQFFRWHFAIHRSHVIQLVTFWLPIWRSLNQFKGSRFFHQQKKSHQQKSSPNFRPAQLGSWSGCRGGVRCRPCIARKGPGKMWVSWTYHTSKCCRFFLTFVPNSHQAEWKPFKFGGCNWSILLFGAAQNRAFCESLCVFF